MSPPLAEVIDCFSACGRCSYFWAGYRVIAGEEVVETAVKENDPVWLTLPWSHPVRELIVKSYGIRFDVAYFHHEGSCKECQRQFVYDEEDEELDDGPEVIEAASQPEDEEANDEEVDVVEVVEEPMETTPVVRAHFKIERMPCASKA